MRGPSRHGNQLRLFMSGNEIIDSLDGSVDSTTSTRYDSGWHGEEGEQAYQDTWDAKREENLYRDSWKANIAEHGFKRHITIQPTYDDNGEPIFVHGDGHHRTALAADMENESGREVYVPTVYDHNYMWSSGSGRSQGDGNQGWSGGMHYGYLYPHGGFDVAKRVDIAPDVVQESTINRHVQQLRRHRAANPLPDRKGMTPLPREERPEFRPGPGQGSLF